MLSFNSLACIILALFLAFVLETDTFDKEKDKKTIRLFQVFELLTLVLFFASLFIA